MALRLEGITPDDYLAWVRDPEPAALGRDLRAVAARAVPRSNCIDIQLLWDREPPSPHDAATTAGFPLTPNVAELRDYTRAKPSRDDIANTDTNAFAQHIM